jgi:hypothetical protein
MVSSMTDSNFYVVANHVTIHSLHILSNADLNYTFYGVPSLFHALFACQKYLVRVGPPAVSKIHMNLHEVK